VNNIEQYIRKLESVSGLEKAKVLNEIGDIYKASNTSNESLTYYKKALEISKSIKNKQQISCTLNKIGVTYFDCHKYDEAYKYLEEGLKLANEIEDKYLLKNLNGNITKLLMETGNYKDALEYHIKYSDIKETILNEENSLKLSEIAKKHERENKEKESEIYRLKNIELVDANKKLKEANEIIRKKNRELTETHKKLELLARTDALTHLSNRRDILEKIRFEQNRFERYSKPFSLILSDIDNFKHFNDQYGHECGDFVLISVADLMKLQLRKMDSISRWGGEEFLILLPETNLENAQKTAERIREAIANEKIVYNNEKLVTTMTFGVSCYNKSMSIEYCIKRADDSMYIGKQKGKNCVIVAEEK